MVQTVYIVYSSEPDNTMIYGVFSTMEKALAEAYRLKTATNVADTVYDDWARIGDLLVDSYDVE